MPASNRFKKSVIAGLVVVLPLLVSGLTLVWVARLIEGTMSPLLEWLLGTSVPGLGFASALVLVSVVGLVATTVVGSRLLEQGESIVSRIPLFKDIYVPVKQLVSAFSPENEAGFKRVVLVPYAGATGLAVGFLTREFHMEGADGRRDAWASVYVPTNHLYLGDVHIIPASEARYPDLTVEEGIRIFLTGGMSLPNRMRGRRGDDRVRDFRV